MATLYTTLIAVCMRTILSFNVFVLQCSLFIIINLQFHLEPEGIVLSK